MKGKRIAVLGLVLAGCADEGNIRERLDALETGDSLGEISDASDGTTGDVASEVDASDTTVDTLGDTADAADTTPDAPDTTDTTDATDTTSDTAVDTTPGDTVIGPWEVDPDAPWALGRPTVVTGSEGAADVGTPVLVSGRYAALAPVRIASGTVVVDGSAFPAPEEGGHGAIVALKGDLLTPSLGTVVYLDGPLTAPEQPLVTVCDGLVYASINDQSGFAARLVRLSGDLETIDIALFAAKPGAGNGVRLGQPVCGGPGFVVTLDAVGGAVFTAPNGARSEFLPEQTANKTLIINGARVFADNGAQTVSATSMRVIQITGGAAQEIFYVGEATVERQIGDTTLLPGDQLVYHHDYASGAGGSIASQGFFGRDDVSLLATAPDGRFAVVWSDVTPGVNPGDPDTLETVVSAFTADGARAWNKRSSAWAIDRLAFDEAGDLRIAGRFRSLEAIGVATGAVGAEDAFLAVLSGADGTRLRHVVLGVGGIASGIVGPIFDGVGDGDCAALGALDAVMIATGPTRVAIGVAADNQRCATQGLTAGDGQLRLAPAGLTAGAVDFWLTWSGGALGAGHGTPWPAGQGLVGPIRGRFQSPL